MHSQVVSAHKQTGVWVCRRLNLDSLEQLLEIPDVATRRRVEVALRVLPQSWSMHVDMAREEIAWTLQTLSVNAIELSNLWYMQNFHEKLLVEVSSAAFQKQLPMEAFAFEQVRYQPANHVVSCS